MRYVFSDGRDFSLLGGERDWPAPIKVDVACRADHVRRTRRRDVWSIPVAAIREVVINALVHASYSAQGTPIRVAFMDDRIEVESPGGLLPGMTVEDMIGGVSSIRNPVLARVFREMRLMEQWGTGVRGVFRSLAELGLPAPQIEELPGRLRVVVPIPNHRPSIPATPGTTRGAPRRLSEQAKSPSHQAVSPSHQVTAVLTVALNEPATREDLLKALGLSNETRNARRHIFPLVEGGYLARTLPDQPTSPKQRYLITEAGRELLEREHDQP